MTQQTVKVRGVADIVFLIDVTGSMQPCIDALKKNIETFATSLSTPDGNGNLPVKEWRARVVGYRDFEEDKEHIVDHQFTSDVGELRRQLMGLKADGGGDEPESLLDALYYVAGWEKTDKGEAPQPNKWRYQREAARVVVAFTDASYKEPTTIPPKGGLSDVMNALTSNKIVLSFFAPDMDCYKRLAKLDPSEWNVLDADPDPRKAMELFTADQKNFQATMRQLAKTVSASAEAIPI